MPAGHSTQLSLLLSNISLAEQISLLQVADLVTVRKTAQTTICFCVICMRIQNEQLQQMISYIARRLGKGKFQRKRQLKPQDLPDPKDTRRAAIFISGEANSITGLSEPNYMMVRKWLAQSIPSLTPTISGSSCQDLFALCNKMKVHREIVFKAAEAKLEATTRGKCNLAELSQIYETAVNLKHTHSLDLLHSVRGEMVRRLREKQHIDKITIAAFLSFLSSLCLDIKVDGRQKQEAIRELGHLIANSLPVLERNKQSRLRAYSILFEQATLYDVGLPLEMMEILKGANVEMDKQRNGEQVQPIDGHYLSTFERIFENALGGLGYNFAINTIIKGYEYDVIVSGKVKQKFCPLATPPPSTLQSAHRPFSVQEVRSAALMRSSEWRERKAEFSEKVVLGLNGPIHYVDSDIHPPQTITRNEEFQYERLRLYGIRRFQLINYGEWEPISRHTRLMKQYIESKINNSMRLHQ